MVVVAQGFETARIVNEKKEAQTSKIIIPCNFLYNLSMPSIVLSQIGPNTRVDRQCSVVWTTVYP